MAEPQAVYTTDEYGRPFIIVREQAKKTRSHGIEAIKVRNQVSALLLDLT
jgi:T-complex protein 1 subunit epsilon